MSGRDLTPEPGDIDQAPARWSDGAASSSDPAQQQQRLAALWRKLPPPAELPAARLNAVRARLPAPDRARAAGAGARGLRPWAWALAALLLLLGSGVVAAARGWVPWAQLRSGETAPAPAPAVLASAKPPRRQTARAATPEAPAPMLAPALAPALAAPPLPAPVADPLAVEPPSLAPPSLPPALEPPPPATARPRPGRSPSARPTPATPVAAATVVPADLLVPPAPTEASVLEAAVATLRRQGDARAALQLLDRYDERFAHGLLAQEADRLRIDAWLLLGDRRRALQRLNQVTLSEGARDLELLLIRGELRAALADCTGAPDDFGRVLARVADPALIARARAGMAACARPGAAGAR